MQTKETITFDLLKDMRSNYGPELFGSGVIAGENTVLLFGPYATLAAGRWTVSVSGEVAPSEHCYVDATIGGGALTLGVGTLVGDRCTFDVEGAFPLDRFEVRVHAASGSSVRIDNVSVERQIDPRRQRSFSLVDRMQLSLFLDPTSLVDRAVIDIGSWDKDHLDYMIQNTQKYAQSPGDLVFLDIGSYFGLYAMVLARTNLFGKVVAFEADVLNFRQLCANLLLNDPLCFIEPRFIAVSNGPGEAMFESSLFHPEGNRGGVGVNEEGSRADADKKVVATDSIDNLVPLVGKKIFAKIDVEGHELKVLDGMRQTIARNKVFLQVETFLQLREVSQIMDSLGCTLTNRIGDDYYFTNFE